MQAEAEPEELGCSDPRRTRLRAGGGLALAALLGLWVAAQPASARESRVERAQRSDGPVYFIGELVPEYATPGPQLPPLGELDEIEFELGRTVDGYVAPREGVRTLRWRLAQLASAPTQRIYASGLQHINEQIVTWLNRHGLRGVRVRPHPEDIERGTNRDLRPRDETRLRLLITLGTEGAESQWKIHAAPVDGVVYPIDAIIPEYAEYHSDHPPLPDLDRAVFTLGRTADGYVAPRPGVRSIHFRLSDLAAAPAQRIYASGLRSLNEQIVAWLNEQGLRGVLVRPNEEDIDPDSGEDLRPQTRPQLRILIWTGRIKEVRTFASGQRVPEDERVDHPSHERIKDRSPIKPGAVRGLDLVQKRVLDDYVARLNRHPGRRVNVALSPGREPGGVNLDYLIAENKPWTAYAQWNNAGTDQTTDSRQRFGFTHTQLTGRDDILRLDYLTGNFDEVNALSGAYEAPLFGYEGLRWRVHGSTHEFDASVLGFPGRKYKGDQWGVGAELIANLYQRNELFLDLVTGVRWSNIKVNEPDIFALENAEDSFLLPRAGLRLERRTETSSLFADLMFELNSSGLSGNDADDPTEQGGLGRLNSDEDWTVLRWDTSFTSYLEPLLDPAAWADPTTPTSSTLAHEIALLFRGQYAFGNRLIPQEERIAGGFYTVRGYPQAAAAGDSVFIGSVEYRFHVPQIFQIQREPVQVPVIGDFRIARPRVYGRPDWDLILRVFIDGASVLQSTPREPFDNNETLLSAGIGGELQLWRNVIGRVDLGVALADSDDLDVDRGDTEVHLSVTTLY